MRSELGQMHATFEAIFKSGVPARDKYLSRLFGLFSESIVHEWCSCSQAPYHELGRPTLWSTGETRGSTLDFTLRHNVTRQTFVAEMKCWPEFEKYRYLRLTGSDQITRIKEPVAFFRLLQMAKNPASYEVRVGGQPISVNGAVLIWCAVTDEGRAAVMTQLGFADVLSVESMLADLHSWGPASWNDRIQQLKQWSDDFFDILSP